MELWQFKHFTREEAVSFPKKGVFKNYRELCEHLGLEVKHSNSKISQMKEIECILNIKKEGRKFTILNKKKIPSKKVDGRSNGNRVSPFLEDLKTMILKYLLDKGGKVYTTKNNLLCSSGVTSLKYKTSSYNHEIIASEYNIDSEFTSNITCSLNGTLLSSLDTALNRMSNERLLDVMDVYVIKHEDGMIVEVDDDTHIYIMEQERNYIKAKKYNGLKDVFNRREMKDMYEFVSKNMQLPENASVMKIKKILLSSTHVKMKIHWMLKTIDIEEIQERLRISIFDVVKNNSISRINGYTGQMSRLSEFTGDIDTVLNLLLFDIGDNSKIKISNYEESLMITDDMLPF